MTARSWDAPGSTALAVPVPEAEPAVAPLRRRVARPGADDVAAHVTLLVPFAPLPATPELDALVASWVRAPFVLRRARRWPGLVWLDPEPAAPFVAMTHALVEAFPPYRPYDGAHEEVTPHLTVATSDDEAALDEIAAEVERALPIACAGDTVELLERGDDLRWHVRRTWTLSPH
jgi:2'-5' RNA ligase